MGLSLRNIGKKILGAGEAVVSPFVNTAKMVGDIGSLGAAEITHNPIAQAHASQAFSNSARGSVIGPLANLAVAEGTNLAAPSVLQKARLGDIGFGQAQDILNQGYAPTGVNLNTSTGTAVRKFGAQAGLGALNLASLGSGSSAAAAAEKPLVRIAGEQALQYGPASGVLQTLSQDKPTVGSLVKNTAVQTAMAGGIPLAVGGVRAGVAHAGELPAMVAKADQAAFTPRASLHDQAVLSAYKDHLSGANTLAGKEASDLIAQARQVGQKHGIDLITGSPRNRMTQADRVLTQLGTTQREGGYIKVPGGGSPTPPKVSLKNTTSSVRGGVNSVGKGSEAEHYANTFGISEAEAAKELKSIAAQQADVNKRYIKEPPSGLGPVSQSIKNQLNPPPSQAERLNLGNPKNNPLYGKVVIPDAADAGQAHLNAQYVMNTEHSIGREALDKVKALSPNDQKLMRSTQIKGASIASKAENPQAFREALDAVRSYYDTRHAFDHALGIETPYRQNYLRDIVERNSEGTRPATGGSKAPGYTLAKTQPGYSDVATALERDVRGASYNHAKLTYAQGLEQAYPNQISRGQPNVGPEGLTQQLMTPYGNELFATKNLASQINKRAPAPKASGALKGYDVANATLKQAKLGGGLFHGLTTTGTVAGQQVASGNILLHPIENLKVITGTISNKAHQAHLNQIASNGADHVDGLSTAQRMDLAGVTRKAEQIQADVRVKASEHIPVISNIHKMVFDRQIPEAKALMFEQATKGLDANIPEDLAKMRGVGKAVNNLGGINRAVDGLTPATAKRLSRVLLATDFTEGKFRTIVSAISKGGPEGNLARQMVVGKTIVFALPGLAALTAQGKINWNDPKDVEKNIRDQVLDPSVPTKFKSPGGYSKVAKTPETFVSEIGRIVKPLFDGSENKASGAEHYAQARLAALPAVGVQLRTNKDYQGNPIIARDTNGKVRVGKTAQNIGINTLPIPASQSLKVAQGKQSKGEAAVNTLGFRTVVDQNDPNYKKVQAYFKNKDNFTKSLTPDEQALFTKLNPTKTDQYGNKVTPSKTTLTTPSNYSDLLANPSFTAKYQAYKSGEKNHDPLWDLPKDQLRAYMQAQVISKNDPGGDSNTVRQLYAKLPQDFFTKREQYFASLKSQGVNLGPQQPQKPQMPDELVKFSESYHNLPYGTGARSAALRSPQGQAYIQYLNNNRIYNNQERADLGLPPLTDTNTNKSYPYSSRHKYISRTAAELQNPYLNAIDIGAGGKKSVGKSTLSKTKAKVAVRARSSKPRVSIKKAMA